MCSVTAPARCELPGETTAPRLARAFLRQATCTEHRSSVPDEAELLVSELVTNAVVHGAPPVTVHVECDGTRGMRVCVSDDDPTVPKRQHADLDDEGGRGITLVDLISDRWGVHTHPDHGKGVWFELHD